MTVSAQATEHEPPLIDVATFFADPHFANPSISSDGTRIAYLAPHRGRLNVWVRGIDRTHDDATGETVPHQEQDDPTAAVLFDRRGEPAFRTAIAADGALEISAIDPGTGATRLLRRLGGAEHPMGIQLYDHATGAARLLFRSYPNRDPAAAAPMTPVGFPSRDGSPLHAHLTLLVGIEPRDLPLVLVVHGGPWYVAVEAPPGRNGHPRRRAGSRSLPRVLRYRLSPSRRGTYDKGWTSGTKIVVCHRSSSHICSGRAEPGRCSTGVARAITRVVRSTRRRRARVNAPEISSTPGPGPIVTGRSTRSGAGRHVRGSAPRRAR